MTRIMWIATILSIFAIGVGMNQVTYGQWYDYSTGTYHATGNASDQNLTKPVTIQNTNTETIDTQLTEPETYASTSQDEANSIQTFNQNQYSAYSGVPFPNCVETVSEKTVILHFVGSCSGDPSFENLKYYSDFGYHVQNII